RGLDQIANRLWLRHGLHLLARAVWLALAFGCLWLVADLAGGPAFQWQGVPWAAGPLVVLALIFAVRNRPGRYQTARMLDRSFGLHDRVTTTLDHLGQGLPRDGERATIIYLQMADAANVITDAKQHPALRLTPPVRELVPGLGFALVLAALFFLRGTGAGIPELAAASVPQFTPAVARQPEADQTALSPEHTELAPTVDEVMERSRRSNAAQQDLQRLAAALDDHATTKPAADAITEGEYAAAAGELRDFASQADQLSPAAREAMARDLSQAATGMAPENDDLRRATDQAATGLREGGEPARTTVEELGNAVERTGDNVASQQELADQMQRAQESEGRQQAGSSSSRGDSADPSSGQSEASEQSAASGQNETGDSAASGESGAERAGQPAASQQSPADAGQEGSGEARGEPGDGAAEAGSGQGGEPGAPAEAQGVAGEPQTGDGAGAGEGAGASGGDSDGDAAIAGQDQGGSMESAPGPGEAEQRVSDASGDRVQAENPGDGRATTLLPAAPGEEGVQTVNNAGGTVRGSGAGITAGSGSAVQTAIDQAGPDSNHVPEPYRPVVERYFSNLDDD
ncbi:MAG: hypothetical protein H0V24_14775, partial [Chloroflexia bacterium]|nr:hypothetical protein [Chloroflexia bacterium]